jgi:hypothetical protein
MEIRVESAASAARRDRVSPVLREPTKEEQVEPSAVYIDLDAFVKDILEGDAEWFERIAERELKKRTFIRTNPA